MVKFQDQSQKSMTVGQLFSCSMTFLLFSGFPVSVGNLRLFRAGKDGGSRSRLKTREKTGKGR